MGKHIIEIMFQFENIADAVKEQNVSENLNDAMGDAGEKAANTLREKLIPVATELRQAFDSIDWGHPIRSVQRVASAMLTNLQNRLGFVGKLALGAAASFAGLIKSLIEPQKQMVDLFAQLPKQINFSTIEGADLATTMGDKVHRSLMSVMNVAQKMGTSLSDTAATYASLGQMRVPVGDLEALTEVSLMASKALGSNVEQTTELAGKLAVMGRLNQTQITGLFENFSKIQDAVGLTNNEMSQLIETTSELTRYLGAFGAAPEDIQAMAGATAKLTGLFGELGLGAERAGQIMSRIFDPSRLGENVMLINQMGMSMQEYMNMLQGGQVDQVKLTEGLVDAAGQIEEMRQAGVNAFALQQRAQQMGFSNVQEALRLAQDGDETLARMNEEVERFGQSLQDAAAEGMSNLGEATTRLKNRFLATFAQAMVPVVGKLTTVVEALERRFLENEAAIMNFIDTAVTGFAEWIANVDMEKVIQWFKDLWSGIQTLIEGVKAIVPVLVTLAAAFAGLKVISVIAPLFGGLSDVLGKLVPKLGNLSSAASGASQTVGQFGSAMVSSLQAFLKMGGVALVIMAVAGAIWVLAQALVKFNEVDWSSLAKAGVTLVALTAAMVGLGALFMSPAGAALIAGMAALGAMAVVIAAVGAALLTLGAGLKAISADALAELAEIANEDLAEDLRTVGLAIRAFAKGVGLFAVLNARAIQQVGSGIKELALGLWVLSKVPNFTDIAEDLSKLGVDIKELLRGRFRGNVEEVGEAFEALTEGIKTLTELETDKLGDLGSDMMEMSEGLGTWLQAMKSGAAFDLFGMGKDIAAVGEGFKELSLGMWVMGKAAEGTTAFLNNSSELAEGVSEIVGALRDAPMLGAEGKAGALSSMLSALSNVGGLDNIGSNLTEAAGGVSALGQALSHWTEKSLAARQFIDFLEGLRAAGPIEVDMRTPEGEEVDVRGRMTELEGTATTEVSLRAAFEEQTSRVVRAIESLEDSLVGEDGASGLLGTIMGTMGQWNRTGLKTRT